MLVPIACGGGSASWFDLGEPFQFLDALDVSLWSMVGVLLLASVVGFVIVVAAFTLSTVIESWRAHVPVPQVTNPILEGATSDLERAVDMLRRSSEHHLAAPLIENAKAKSARATGRLSRSEQRQLDRAWQIVRWSGA